MALFLLTRVAGDFAFGNGFSVPPYSRMAARRPATACYPAILFF
jgi:hypothetical protein